jgi:hypothetical protein
MTNHPWLHKPSTCQVDEKALSHFWRLFNDKFKCEADCVEELHRWLANVLKCKHCGSRKLEKPDGRRILKCSYCWKKTWFTAGTFFNRIRSTRPWLAAIWLLERGIIVSISRFHRLVNIAYSSAQAIFKKLMIIINDNIGDDSLPISSGKFSRIFCKRSAQTPARMHPVSEQHRLDEQAEKRLSSSSSDSCSFNGNKNTSPGSHETLPGDGARTNKLDFRLAADVSEFERIVLHLISGEPVQFDKLCFQANMPVGTLSATLTMLELSGLVERLSGDIYRRVNLETRKSESEQDYPSQESSGIVEISRISAFVCSTFHGISRKYLQFYLCAYWCNFDRRKWHPGALATECIKSGPIIYKQVLEYVSPPLVKVPASVRITGDLPL